MGNYAITGMNIPEMCHQDRFDDVQSLSRFVSGHNDICARCQAVPWAELALSDPPTSDQGVKIMDIPETHQDLKTSQCRVCQLLATIKQAEYDDSACTLLRFCARPVLRDHVEGIEVPQFAQNDGQVLGCGFDNNSTFTWFRKAGFIGITHSTRHAEFGIRRIDLNSADFDLVKGPLYQGLELLIAKASFLRLSQLHINCIDQNNEAHRSQQIACMGDIYANAELAIIAASKNHADYRLPGVDSTARQDQPQVQIGPVKLLEGHRHPSHELLDTPWSTRGWTLQESILSRRRMIFSDTEVTFLCNTIHWAESWLSPGLDADFRANLKFRGLIPLAHNDKAHGLTIRYIDAVALGTVDVPQVPLPVDDDVPDTETLIIQMLIAVDMDEEEFVPPVIGVVLYSCTRVLEQSRIGELSLLVLKGDHGVYRRVGLIRHRFNKFIHPGSPSHIVPAVAFTDTAGELLDELEWLADGEDPLWLKEAETRTVIVE
ncbi:uncharacterized protein JN550_008465 [Neoarthrinium moseri]|uniref:uncharacterized protein n=1 Tax=Neoarthrinium moseri TaxID=1658444 RepID=UPI001FDE7AE9|nr:uncharacterized protein JN550_008465 [Neoarthrinium moseri]KAI1865417.1 hypothetical protein JN550_008465 [Neoarthrinium moseri]